MLAGVVLFVIALLKRGGAQELSAAGGIMGTGVEDETSYAWQLGYRHALGEWFAWSGSWLNEGHARLHHRDGLALQLWLVPIAQPGVFSLAFGAGGYRYADTRYLPNDGYTNEHGWTAIASVSATFYTESPWFLRATANHVQRTGGLETNSLLVGGGYELGWRRVKLPRREPVSSLTAFYGRTIVNSRSSPQASAVVVEYRRMIWPHLDWTASLIDEGDPQIIRREGVATQIWLIDASRDRRIAVGLGLGPYLVFERKSPNPSGAERELDTAAILTPTVSYRFARDWEVRLSWNRVFSHANRDADVVACGLGYRWGGD